MSIQSEVILVLSHVLLMLCFVICYLFLHFSTKVIMQHRLNTDVATLQIGCHRNFGGALTRVMRQR